MLPQMQSGVKRVPSPGASEGNEEIVVDDAFAGTNSREFYTTILSVGEEESNRFREPGRLISRLA